MRLAELITKRRHRQTFCLRRPGHIATRGPVAGYARPIVVASSQHRVRPST